MRAKPERPVASIDHYRYNLSRTQRAYFATRQRSLQAKSSLRFKLARLNQSGGIFSLAGGGFSPGLKVWAILFLVVSASIGAVVFYSQPGNSLFHSYGPNPAYHSYDPITLLWQANSPSADLSEFNTLLASYSASAGSFGATPSIKLVSNSTFAALALSKNPVSLSTIASKELIADFNFQVSGACCGDTTHYWGWYLTTNATLPLASGYNPLNDKSVGLVQVEQAQGGGTYASLTWLQRNYAESISSEDVGGCSQAGSTFKCSPTTGLTLPGIGGVPPNFQVILNETGSTGSTVTNCPNVPGGGVNCSFSFLADGNGGISSGGTKTLPWFAFQSVQYYIGFFVTPGLATNVFFTFNAADNTNVGNNNSMFLGIYTPTPVPAANAPVVEPTVDTGGFFGPVIRALIQIGVFIAQNMLGFASYLFNKILQPAFNAILNALAPALATLIGTLFTVVKQILDAIGSAIGVGSIGTNLFTLLGDLNSFFTSFFGNVLGQMASFVTAANNLLTTAGNVLGSYWTNLANALTALSNILTGLWTVINLVGFWTQVGMGGLVSIWLLYGSVEFMKDLDLGMKWFNQSSYFMLLGWSITYYFTILLLNHVIIPILQSVTAFSTSESAARPPDVGGFGG